jgi:hypothetical protein
MRRRLQNPKGDPVWQSSKLSTFSLNDDVVVPQKVLMDPDLLWEEPVSGGIRHPCAERQFARLQILASQ